MDARKRKTPEKRRPVSSLVSCKKKEKEKGKKECSPAGGVHPVPSLVQCTLRRRAGRLHHVRGSSNCRARASTARLRGCVLTMPLCGMGRTQDRQGLSLSTNVGKTEAFKRLGLSIMGTASSKLEKSLPSSFPDDERLFGLENFGNTCYCNSVLQALYFCVPFREAVLEWAHAPSPCSKIKSDEESMLFSVAETFSYISSHKKKFGVYVRAHLVICASMCDVCSGIGRSRRPLVGIGVGQKPACALACMHAYMHTCTSSGTEAADTDAEEKERGFSGVPAPGRA